MRDTLVDESASGRKNPQATLDVAGVIRTGKRYSLPDGSVLTSAGTTRGKTGKTSSETMPTARTLKSRRLLTSREGNDW